MTTSNPAGAEEIDLTGLSDDELAELVVDCSKHAWDCGCLACLLRAMRRLDAGDLDDLYADAEAKAQFRADLREAITQAAEKMLREDPYAFQRPDGAWDFLPDDKPGH